MTPRRGSVLLIVMWALALGALVVSSVQLFGYRQAMCGREALDRVQARWAARGGIEYTISILAEYTAFPEPNDAFAMVREMDAYAQGEYELDGRIATAYDIRHYVDGIDWLGPMDEHSKININTTPSNPNLLHNLQDMSPDVVDAIIDWIDEDDEVRMLGAEREYYLGLSAPYEPRNSPMFSIAELELVAGVWPEHVRGEDWNYNNRIDANENDGDRTWPMDEPDQRLDARWSGLLTAYSTGGGPAMSGLPRLRLGTAQPQEVQERLGVDEQTAASLISYGKGPNNRFSQLLSAYAQQQAAASLLSAGETDAAGGNSIVRLTEDELRAVFAEATMGNPHERGPGKLNINTASELVLRQLLFGKEYLADEIIYLRSTRPEGITSMVDLLQIPAFREDTATLQYIADLMDVRSNVYSICARGRAYPSGLEVETIAVVDRSALPLRIMEYREQ